jgi:flagellar protein FliO/FliZ
MGTWVNFFIIFLVVLALIGVIAWLVRWLGGGSARRRQPRLAVIDSASIDRRRTLVLIRRDNVERLVMIGGPNDVVIEQNVLPAIGAPQPVRRAASRSDVRAVEFSNQLASAEVPPRPQPMQPRLPSTRKLAPPLEPHPPQSVYDVRELRETLKALLNDFDEQRKPKPDEPQLQPLAKSEPEISTGLIEHESVEEKRTESNLESKPEPEQQAESQPESEPAKPEAEIKPELTEPQMIEEKLAEPGFGSESTLKQQAESKSQAENEPLNPG